MLTWHKFKINMFLYLFVFVEIASFDTGAKIFAGVAEKNKLIQKYLDTMNDADIDLLILPASLVPAPKKVNKEKVIYI